MDKNLEGILDLELRVKEENRSEVVEIEENTLTGFKEVYGFIYKLYEGKIYELNKIFIGRENNEIRLVGEYCRDSDSKYLVLVVSPRREGYTTVKDWNKKDKFQEIYSVE